MSSDECFNEFIEYDSDDSDKKNDPSSSKRKRTQRRTELQFKKMCDFMNAHSKEMLGRRAFEDAWDILVSQLNEIGPPSHTSDKWKKIWFDYKSKNKKKPKLSSIGRLKSSDESHPEIESPIEQQTTSSSAAILNKHLPLTKGKLEVVETVVPSHRDNPQGHQTTSSLSSLENIENSSFRLNVMAKLDSVNEETKKIKEYMKQILAEGKKTNELLEKMLTQ